MPQLLDPPQRPQQPPLWLSWEGTRKTSHWNADAVRDVGDGRRAFLPPTIWEAMPDGTGVFNRAFVRIPPAVMARDRPVLYRYRLWESEDDQDESGTLTLPLVAPELFEQTLPYLPPGAIQIRHFLSCHLLQPNWRVMPINRNPYRAWDRRMTIYAVPGKPSKPTANVFFADDGTLVSAEIIDQDYQVTDLAGPGGEQILAQFTRMWIGFSV